MWLHVTPSDFLSVIVRSEALVYNSYFLRTVVLRKLFDTRENDLLSCRL